jgi:toxin ParE1/3/4
MKIRWTTPAAGDLESIFNYLQENHPSQARPTVVEIRSSVRSLKQFPYRGRKGSEEGTRELPHARLPYILTYRVKNEVIEILHIWHGAQNRH